MDFSQVVSCLLGGSALTALGAVLSQYLKVKSDTNLAKDQQEFNQQEKIIEDLRRRIEFLEKAITECVQDRSDLRYKIGHLEGRLDSMQEDKTNKIASQLATVATNMSDSAIRLQKAADKTSDTQRDIGTIHE